MRSMYKCWLVMSLACAFAVPVRAETKTWNVKDRYGITVLGIRRAIRAAKAHFLEHPNDILILQLDKGTYVLEDRSHSYGTIDLSGIKPGAHGRLVLRGAGPEQTTLVFGDNKHALYGRGVYRVTVSQMHMTRKKYTVSQGLVVDVEKGKVVLEIQQGFPSPQDIFNPQSDQGRYLRRYTNSATQPEIVEEMNEQIAWERARHLGGQRWEIQLKKRNLVPNYRKGQLIGIKSKHGGQAYWFKGGSDFAFENVKWTHKTRGVFRGGFDKIHVVRCVTERAAPINGQVPCLASPGGGPQIGQPGDSPITGNLVAECRFIASGDDAVAFFNAAGEISNCYISDAFCRGILLSNSPAAVLKDNQLVRGPVQRSKDFRLPKKPQENKAASGRTASESVQRSSMFNVQEGTRRRYRQASNWAEESEPKRKLQPEYPRRSSRTFEVSGVVRSETAKTTIYSDRKISTADTQPRERSDAR